MTDKRDVKEEIPMRNQESARGEWLRQERRWNELRKKPLVREMLAHPAKELRLGFELIDKESKLEMLELKFLMWKVHHLRSLGSQPTKEEVIMEARREGKEGICRKWYGLISKLKATVSEAKESYERAERRGEELVEIPPVLLSR